MLLAKILDEEEMLEMGRGCRADALCASVFPLSLNAILALEASFGGFHRSSPTHTSRPQISCLSVYPQVYNVEDSSHS